VQAVVLGGDPLGGIVLDGAVLGGASLANWGGSNVGLNERAWRRPGRRRRIWWCRGRPHAGKLAPSGEVSFGLKPGQAAELRRILRAADLGARGRNGLRSVAPVVAMTVTAHGKLAGWLRDPVITAVHIDPSGPQAR
jgi:hypothetical protein